MQEIIRKLYTNIVKRILIIIVLFLIAFPLLAVEIEIPYKDISDDVKSVKTSHTREENQQAIPTKEIEYTKFGAKRIERLYRDNGNIKWTIFYEYRNDDKIALIQAKTPEGAILWKTNYEYDSKSRLVKKTTFNSKGQPDYTTVYEYQADRTEVLAYGPNGSLQWRKKVVTSEDRNIRETYFYYPGGTRIKGIVEEFNSYGKQYKETHIDEIGTVFRRIETEHDIFGRVIGRTVYNHIGNVHRRVWIEYLPHGHIGLVRQVVPSENRVEEYSYSYEIDKRGSWTYRQEIVAITDDSMKEPKIFTTTETRKIEYFSEAEGER